MKFNEILNRSNKFNFDNKIILILFSFTYIIFSFYIIDQYSNILSYFDLYRHFLGDGDAHISKIYKIDQKLNLHKIHDTTLYNNNYYIFSLSILKFLKIFPGYNYSLVGMSAVIINLLSIFIICVTGYLICFNISKSKIFSFGIILLLWNADLIRLSLSIYPDILQLAFIFLATYFITLDSKYKWFLSFIFCGLAFGVKAQGLLIFLYLITFYFTFELAKHDININNFIISVLRNTLLYSSLFLITFFILNQIDPSHLLKNLLATVVDDGSIKEYDNTRIAFNNFIYILRGKSNLIIFLTIIIFGLISIFYEKKNKILFLVTLIFLILFYYQLSSNSFFIQGPRYFYHLLPLLIILLSIVFFNISNYLYQKKLSIIPLIISIIFLFYGLNLFNKNFFLAVNYYDFKTKIKKDQIIDGYNFLKTMKDKDKNHLVCAGYYSPVPMKYNGFTRILKSYRHLDFEKQIRNKECDIIVLDNSTPGRYIWFKDNLDNLIIKKYENLATYNKILGKDKIEKTQILIKYILTDHQSGYQVDFFNSKMIILTKK